MYKISTILVFVLLATSAVFADLSFKGNASLSASSATDWKYRRTSLGWSNILGIGWFTSANVERQGNSLSADLLVGGIKGGRFSYPSSYLAYFTSDANANVTGNNVFSLDVTATANFIASAYLAVVERDTAGNVVYALDLKTLSWDLTDQKTNGELKYGVWVGSSGTYKVQFTIIVSSVAGVVDLADAVVTPKVMETVVTINNWPYKAATNALTLVTIAATGSGNANGNVYAAGSGSAQVYFQLNTEAVVSGAKRQVTISSSAVALSDFKVDDIRAQLNAKFSGSVTAHIFNVTFPAGASAIVYDPTLGSGATIQQQESSSAVIGTNVFFILAVISFVAGFLL